MTKRRKLSDYLGHLTEAAPPRRAAQQCQEHPWLFHREQHDAADIDESTGRTLRHPKALNAV